MEECELEKITKHDISTFLSGYIISSLPLLDGRPHNVEGDRENTTMTLVSFTLGNEQLPCSSQLVISSDFVFIFFSNTVTSLVWFLSAITQ